jgi:hypothetical protein
MSKMFSIVTLTAESGETEEFFARGMPQDEDDIFNLDEATDFFDDLSMDQWITVEVKTYVYGEGETEPADNLEAIKQNFEKISKIVDCIRDNTFTLDLERDFSDSYDESSEYEDEL